MPWINKQLSARGLRRRSHQCNTPYPVNDYERGSEWRCWFCRSVWVIVQSPLIPDWNAWERRNDALDFTKSFVNHPSNGLLIRPNSDSL